MEPLKEGDTLIGGEEGQRGWEDHWHERWNSGVTLEKATENPKQKSPGSEESDWGEEQVTDKEGQWATQRPEALWKEGMWHRNRVADTTPSLAWFKERLKNLQPPDREKRHCQGRPKFPEKPERGGEGHRQARRLGRSAEDPEDTGRPGRGLQGERQALKAGVEESNEDKTKE